MPKKHEHYCSIAHHDHRWKCQRSPCMLHEACICLICRCGREMELVTKYEDALIFGCPIRPTHLGHDSSVLRLPPVQAPLGTVLSKSGQSVDNPSVP